MQELIPSGSELPYTSEILRGFLLNPGNEEIAIPIKRRSLNNEYVTIANGRLKLYRSYPDGAYVGIKVHMNSNKVISMQMELSCDREGMQVLQTETAEIIVGEYNNAPKLKMVAPSGTRLNVYNELHMLETCCERFVAMSGNSPNGAMAKRIAQCVSSIVNAGNREEFAEPILDLLRSTSNEELRMRLFIIARKQGAYWTETQQRQLVRACENQLMMELSGFGYSGGRKVNANIQAIYALGCFGKPEEVEKLLKLVTMPKYYTQCLYAFGKAKIEGKLLYKKFADDVYYQSARSNLQVTAQALAMALRLDNGKRAEGIDVVQVIKDLCFVLEECAVLEPAHASGHVCSLVALAYACDQRYGNNPLPQESLEMVSRTLKNLNRNYSAEVMKHLVKSANVVRKMLMGEGLSLAEEQFLLKKLDV